LVEKAKNFGLDSKIVMNYQEVLSKSLMFRIVAINRLSKNSGSKTPGVDNIKFINDDVFKMQLVKD